MPGPPLCGVPATAWSELQSHQVAVVSWFAIPDGGIAFQPFGVDADGLSGGYRQVRAEAESFGAHIFQHPFERQAAALLVAPGDAHEVGAQIPLTSPALVG